MSNFKILSVNISSRRGQKKNPVPEIRLAEDHGILEDAHAGDPVRQVSLLAQEDVDTMLAVLPSLKPGDFAENITTRGIDLPSLPLGTILVINDTRLQITKIGKECHEGCAIREQTGDCVMPRRGVFARVLRGGTIRPGDTGYRERPQTR